MVAPLDASAIRPPAETNSELKVIHKPSIMAYSSAQPNMQQSKDFFLNMLKDRSSQTFEELRQKYHNSDTALGDVSTIQLHIQEGNRNITIQILH